MQAFSSGARMFCSRKRHVETLKERRNGASQKYSFSPLPSPFCSSKLVQQYKQKQAAFARPKYACTAGYLSSGSKTRTQARASKGAWPYFSPLLLFDFVFLFVFSFEQLNQVNQTRPLHQEKVFSIRRRFREAECTVNG